jgi:hypothetical protein
MDREEYLHRAIETGKITDGDINDILDHGDRKLKMKLERRTSELEKVQKDLDNKYAPGMFTGIDNQGRLYKDLSDKEVHDAFTQNR